MESDLISLIEDCGSHGYTAEQIANMAGLTGTQRSIFILHLTTDGDEYNTAYRKGFAESEKNIDEALMKQAEKGDTDAIKLIAERSQEYKLRELRKKLFNV